MAELCGNSSEPIRSAFTSMARCSGHELMPVVNVSGMAVKSGERGRGLGGGAAPNANESVQRQVGDVRATSEEAKGTLSANRLGDVDYPALVRHCRVSVSEEEVSVRREVRLSAEARYPHEHPSPQYVQHQHPRGRS